METIFLVFITLVFVPALMWMHHYLLPLGFFATSCIIFFVWRWRARRELPLTYIVLIWISLMGIATISFMWPTLKNAIYGKSIF